ncbi:sensor histidine kinase [Lacrimispora sp.]|jgi:signal transduction histidine kinase|uniref:sensor histidine kinase n=2 Tax=Lacrimispora sp. TaxID=2719234 RepID=UPI00289C1E8F|nr:sensor histidine kinase [Lacrimispora sp.]
MKFSSFLKDKILFLLAQSFLIVFLVLLLDVYHISRYAIILISTTIVITSFVALAYEYLVRSRYYNRLNKTLKSMEQKQYIASLLEEPNFAEAEMLCEILKRVTKAMNDEIASYKISQDEYREYIETWIHEIKIPISCIDLICKNNRNDITKRISEETVRVDSYIEQALYYARSKNVASDYSIRRLSLDSLVKAAVKKHSKQLIGCGAQVKLDNLDHTVYADEKWLDFIIGQIIANSIKYKKDDLTLWFFASENQENMILFIRDNGIGISEGDLGRVFEKGFTGENGRAFAKSTGIGLYLCKELCNKMYLGLEAQSSVGNGTTIKIAFPKDRQSFLQ